MSPQLDDAARFREMSARRARQWTTLFVALGGSFAAVMGAIALFAHRSPAYVALSAVAFMAPFWLGAFLYTRRNWRCPACGSALPSSSGTGYMWRVPTCPRCRVALRG